MKLSIALCTYNGEKFLRQQLDSIVEQTLLPDELVVCDDRSTDSTLEILNDFSQQAPFPVHIQRNEENLGSTKNFEKAINLCQGEIIALCDQDDVWKPEKLNRLVEELDKHPDAGYAFSNAELVDEVLKPIGKTLWESVSFSGDIRDAYFRGDQFYCLTKQHVVTGATMAFRSKLAKFAMPFPNLGNWIHDGWIALVGSSVGDFGLPVDEPLVDYRQHSSQQIGAPKNKKVTKKESLFGMYRSLKKKHHELFADWEKRGLRLVALNDALQRLQMRLNSQQLEKNLHYLNSFETHFNRRRRILTTRHPSRYGLILREAIAGRYTQFSDSWRSIFRDLFL